MATEAESIRPRLRSDLVIEQQRDGNTLRYLIFDPLHNRYWHCGSAQYKLLTLFNGELAPGEIVSRYIEQTHIHLRPEQLDEVLRKLESFSFLVQAPLERANMHLASVRMGPRPFRWQNYVSKSWRIYSADRLLHPLEASTRWLFTPGFLTLYALLALGAGWIIVDGGWHQGIVPTWSGLYVHPSLVIWGRLIVALVITGVMHECAHALTLLHFKRKPGFFGLGVSLLGGLFFYVEISEIWFLSKRGQRVLVSLVGPLTSFLVGAVGAVVWWVLPRSFPFSPWAAALMTAGLLTALYNCVPFFRTDGYFALSDWMRIPNLDHKAQTYILQALLRPFRRQHEPQPKLSPGQHIVVAVYGVIASLATLWFALIVMDFCWWLIVTVVLHHV